MSHSESVNAAPASGRLVVLSNVFDDQYHQVRGEAVDRCLSSAKRRDLFACLELASGREVIVLSWPPKAAQRRSPRWLAPIETRFYTHRQFFCGNWDVPKLRVPLSWWFYAWQVVRHVRDGDIVMLDNYELGYVLAARLTQLLRRVTFLLDYEDGKHVIDRGLARCLSGLAERLGRPLIRGALLAHPALAERLLPGTPSELVPGFMVSQPSGASRVARPTVTHAEPAAAEARPPCDEKPPVRFLYSGSLDRARGVDLLLAALPHLSSTGWRLDITGFGELSQAAVQAARDPRWAGKVVFHGSLPQSAYGELIQQCDIGLNCQRVNDPISQVTFPSKVFSYLSAGLAVLSSRASDVPMICGAACAYYERETPEALAQAMARFNTDLGAWPTSVERAQIAQRYSIAGTAERLETLFAALQNSGRRS